MAFMKTFQLRLLCMSLAGLVTMVVAGRKQGIIEARSSVQEDKRFCVYYYSQISTLPQNKSYASYYPIADLTPWDGCDQPAPNSPINMSGRVVFLNGSNESNCSLTDIAKTIQMLGGAAALLAVRRFKAVGVNETRSVVPITMTSLSSMKTILKMGNPEVLQYGINISQQFSYSLLIIWLLAMVTVVSGAFWGGRIRHRLYVRSTQKLTLTSDEPSQELGGGPEEEVSLPITPISVILVVVILCGSILLMYFFYSILYYFVLVTFCIASTMSLFTCFLPIMARVPCGRCRYYVKLYIMEGWIEVRDVILYFASAAFVISWAVIRNETFNWVGQDLLGVFFCIYVIRLLRLPSLKIITMLSVMLLIYDVFFVFITPYFTKDGQSVMVHVATKDLPMVMRVPRITSEEYPECVPTGEFSMLGFGDIIIPGFLLTFAYSMDLRLKTPGNCFYLVSTATAYGLGLLTTFVALYLMSNAQPALLYLIPFTLTAILVPAAIRKDLKSMWKEDQTEVVKLN